MTSLWRNYDVIMTFPGPISSITQNPPKTIKMTHFGQMTPQFSCSWPENNFGFSYILEVKNTIFSRKMLQKAPNLDFLEKVLISSNFMTSYTQNIFHDDIYLATPTFKLQNEGSNIKIWWVVQILWLFFQIKCFQGKFADRAWKKCWRQQNYDVTAFFS